LFINDTSYTKITFKNSIVDSNNYLNENFPFFDRLYKKLFLCFWLVDTFPDHFLFHTVNCKNIKAKTAHQKKLNRIFDDSISNSNTIIVIFNASIKNNVTTSVLHICNSQNIIAKTIHHVMNIISTKVELFSIRCGIDQAFQVPNIE